MNREQYRMIFRELRIHDAIIDGLLHDEKRMVAKHVSEKFWNALSNEDFDLYMKVNNARQGNPHQVMSDDLKRKLELYRYYRDLKKSDKRPYQWFHMEVAS